MLEGWINLYGYPRYLRSDGGPAFRAEFGDFAKAKGIQLDLSSAYNPTSNVVAEPGVGCVKKLIQRAVLAGENVQDALAAHRNTKSQAGTTPSLLFFGRHLRGVLPALPREVDLQTEIDKREHSRDPWLKEKKTWKGSRVFQIGEKVWCQNPKSELWDVPAEVVEVRKLERSYVLIHERGGTTFL